MSRRLKLSLSVVLILALAAGAGVVLNRGTGTLTGQTPSRRVTTVGGWQIRDSTAVHDDGPKISQPNYRSPSWLSVGPRSTVMAGLLASGGYPDLFFSHNLANVDAAPFRRPWWYRTTIDVAEPDRHSVLRLAGVISRADAWLNGHPIAGSDKLIGIHNALDVDVTGLLRPGRNALALKIYPGDRSRDFTSVWNDWNPPPPDNNLGIWQDVTLTQSGSLALTEPRVTTALELPGLSFADLTVTVDAYNTTDRPVTAQVTGGIGDITWTSTVTLRAKEKRTLIFDKANTAVLHVERPKVWWPTQLGDQPMYRLTLDATVDGDWSDTVGTSFGVRQVAATLDHDGYRVFTVNGKEVLIRGGGWAQDLFLRTDVASLTHQLQTIRDLGLNAVRLEGMLESDEFYDLADRYGILLLPGWTCCAKWEAYSPVRPGEPWVAADYDVAAASMRTVAKRIRNHPSVLTFLIGSDYAPPADIEARYLAELKAAEWPNPVNSSASVEKSPELGSSGMKMEGPYEWVPPSYWYGDERGAAYGFASEISAGPNVPRLESLSRMMTPAEIESLWRSPAATQYHTGGGNGPFTSLGRYNAALFNRYGEPHSTGEYLRATELANYESIRAQFEAYVARMDRPERASTGLIYWMMDNAWPSMIWHLYDYYLAPDAGMYATKKANTPLHVLWQYDNGEVRVANQGREDVGGLAVTAAVYDLAGNQRSTRTVTDVAVPSTRTAALFSLPSPSDVDGTYLVKLTMRDGSGKEIDRNVYWWSTESDQLDWARSAWYYTPVSRYADFRDLVTMARVPLAASATTVDADGTSTVTVTLRNTASAGPPAFFVEATVRGADKQLPAPVRWSDNAVSVWPGETVTISATLPTGQARTIEVAGVNVPATTIALS